jgi:cytosine/adenosine deaminase-related metal-dependent hydrolase
MYHLVDALGLVKSGVDMLAHSVRDQEITTELLEAMKEQGTCLSPTLMREVSTYVYESEPAFFSDPRFLEHASVADLEQLTQPDSQRRSAASAERGKADLVMAQRNLELAYKARIPIAMGTDSGAFTGRFPGYFEHLELELMVEAGMSPMDAIHAATGMAAQCVGVHEDLGTLSPGKRADFIVLNENPLEDIAQTLSIESVWIAGSERPE